MTAFTISLARIPIRIEAIHPELERFCQSYITDDSPAFTVTMTQADIAAEREMSEAEDKREGKAVRRFSDAYLETLAVYRRLASEMLNYDAVVFHSSVVAYDGRAYAFTARSGTGKTTHTGLWLKNIPGTHVLNGDKPMLRLENDQVLACGTPWQGKEKYGTNELLPLEAICILERDAANHIEPVSFRDAFPTLISQIHRPEQADGILKVLTYVGKLDGRVKLYRLGCTMSDEAALVSFRGMTEHLV